MEMEKNPILLSKLLEQSDIPLYSQLVGIVRRNITARTVLPGEILPSEAELCRTFNISRSTVRQAVGILESEGLVIRKQGRGTYVAEPKVSRKSKMLYSFTSEISALGKSPTSSIIDFEVMDPTPDIIKVLELPTAESRVYRFTRLRKMDGEPLMLETSFLPQYIYPELTREMVESNSMYSLLRDVGIIPSSALDSYEAVILSLEEANLLGCKTGSCAFSVERHAKSESGLLYEYTESLIRSDRVKLDVYLQKDGVSLSMSVEK